MSKISYRQTAPQPLRLGDWLRHEREARNLTLAAVAEAVEMDLSLVHKIEKGKRYLTERQAARLARLFEADPADIEARRVAEEIHHYYGGNPATPMALQILNDLPMAPANRNAKTP